MLVPLARLATASALLIVGVVFAVLGRLWRAVSPQTNHAPSPPRAPSPELDPLLTMSASQLARKIRAGEVTSEEVVRKFIERCKEVTQHTNSITDQRYDAAVEEAREADRKPSDRPFHGVPIVIKECFEYPGMLYTAGIVGRKGKRGEGKNPVVERLEREGGFIVIASGNLSEACMWMESANPIYGVTRNPYNLKRTVGGSSGGCSSIVAACGAPCAVTSDVGGSTRIPAFFNGVFGHKPTGGTVSNERTLPTVEGKVDHYCQLGPTARHAEDLLPMLQLMASPDTPIREPPPIAEVTVYSVWNVAGGLPLVQRRDQELYKRQRAVEDALERLGCKVVRDVALPDMKYSFPIWSSMLGNAQVLPFREIITEGKNRIWIGWELLKSLAGRSQHTLPALLLCAVERVAERLPNDHLVQKGYSLQRKLEEMLSESPSVFLMPSLPRCAPEHGFWNNWFLNSSATSIFNVLEFPATQIPLGLHTGSKAKVWAPNGVRITSRPHDAGLPLGLQIVGKRGDDALTLAVAHALHEAGEAGWHPPPL